MSFQQTLHDVQHKLKDNQLDGWLLYDFRRSNPLACQFLEIAPETNLTRRFFYLIPQIGSPIKIISIIESHLLDHLPGEKLTYRSWPELEGHLARLLSDKKQVAMEYSPRNAIPAISKVDAGTIEMIRSYGIEVMSSADLLQSYTSTWTAFQLQTHRNALKILEESAQLAWKLIADKLSTSQKVTEYDVQQFLLNCMKEKGCITSDPPICAVNAHSANPHYTPDAKHFAEIRPGDFILIDLWCKQNITHAVYADITQVGVAAETPTMWQQTIFSVVKEARDATTRFIHENIENNLPVMGWEADQVSRDVITEAGFGNFFIHRTGHNIGEEDHGPGAHLDNLETHDERLLLPETCFSIEPGIYLPNEFGVRLEYDVFIHPDRRVEVTGNVQNSLICLGEYK
ncbi:putative uncharacterized protein [Parachlamydia acanthamoebae UV-7]|jgi:Xaa-Pro aminopeptidase|uniref:Peptidase M24 domain-containing protein n=2 Tax=Parachlamydia acanthamoebae TaxID=83552 RepID=F8L0D6_PARAV|nr:M24 family metallopeptidase [Parachlamydia acanthamoebae]EFB41636.1 hypothetical protein pah_c026o073 [Parachlamydia acanthamoebae str. Hall's coccus]KIA77579.1 hypothetical protein DB43_GD00100 [Parachlamydia acanthamoebae]CCB86666.1 putative uncharacterized protein [Parachlamydia acanthamoebae UV-7]